jgi:hypothetical protein
MDVSDATSYYIQEKNKNKGSQMGQTKKKLKKNNKKISCDCMKQLPPCSNNFFLFL